MKNIIILKEDAERYHHRIDRQNEIKPIPVITDKGEVYTLPLDVYNIPKIDKFFIKLVTLGEVDTILKELPVQDITIIPTEIIKK